MHGPDDWRDMRTSLIKRLSIGQSCLSCTRLRDLDLWLRDLKTAWRCKLHLSSDNRTRTFIPLILANKDYIVRSFNNLSLPLHLGRDKRENRSAQSGLIGKGSIIIVAEIVRWTDAWQLVPTHPSNSEHLATLESGRRGTPRADHSRCTRLICVVKYIAAARPRCRAVVALVCPRCAYRVAPQAVAWNWCNKRANLSRRRSADVPSGRRCDCGGDGGRRRLSTSM